MLGSGAGAGRQERGRSVRDRGEGEVEGDVAGTDGLVAPLDPAEMLGEAGADRLWSIGVRNAGADLAREACERPALHRDRTDDPVLGREPGGADDARLEVGGVVVAEDASEHVDRAVTLRVVDHEAIGRGAGDGEEGESEEHGDLRGLQCAVW